MIMFHSNNNFVNLDSNSNQTDLSTKSSFNNQFNYTSNSPATSNLSEDVSIKSENLFSIDQTIDRNLNAIQNFETNYDQSSIEHLVDLVDKYENQIGNFDEQSYNNQLYENQSFIDNSFNNSIRDSLINSCNVQQQQPYTDYNVSNDPQSYSVNDGDKSIDNRTKNYKPTRSTIDKSMTIQNKADNVDLIKKEFDFQITKTNSTSAILTDQIGSQDSNEIPFDLASNNIKLDLDGSEFRNNLETHDNSEQNGCVEINGKLELNGQLDGFKNQNSQYSETEKRIPRPPNAFMIFGQQNRKLLANQFPQYTNKQISKILGDEWRKMNPEDKAHFHRLAGEAYTKHMKKYPGYYYSPLEARQRKADRKKKFFQKINSRRNYVRQQNLSSSTNLDDNSIANSVQLNQFISFQNSSSLQSSTNESDQSSNEINAQMAILRQQQALDQKQSNRNVKLPTSLERQLMNNQSISQQSIDEFQHHSTGNSLVTAFYSDQTLKFSNSKFSQANQIDQQQLNINQQNNCFSQHTSQQADNLFCSHGSEQQNNMIYNQFTNHQAEPNGHHQNNFNDASSISHQNNIVYHYHHPTIYHVTIKDPNLNSTLNSALIDANNLNMSKKKIANNPFIFTNQLLLQHQQQIYQQQFVQQQQQQNQNDFNSLSAFLPNTAQNENMVHAYQHSTFNQQPYSTFDTISNIIE